MCHVYQKNNNQVVHVKCYELYLISNVLQSESLSVVKLQNSSSSS